MKSKTASEIEPTTEPTTDPVQIDRRGVINPLSIAPMMDRTDRHYRYMMRLLSQHTLLYTEMVTTGAIIHGDRPRHLDFSPQEHPISLQLGGDDPEALAQCAKLAEEWGYDEVNINVGCPSSRVQSGCFGVTLMLRPERVAEAVVAMREATTLPVTVKHRIGVDDVDRYEDMLRFVDIVSEANPDGFTVHARKAWLSGLSPKENRNIPPLRYEEVYRLKRERPHLFVEINGGIKTWDEIESHLQRVDAVMLGRAAYQNPRLFWEADARLYSDRDSEGTAAQGDLGAVAEAMAQYTDEWVAGGGRAHHVTRHLVNLLSGLPGNKKWRRTISERSPLKGAAGDVVRDAWRAAEEQLERARERALSQTSGHAPHQTSDHT